MNLEGTHGTSKENAKEISRGKFWSRGGRFGTGAYFWLFSEFARSLAIEWFLACVSAGHFKELNPECAVIYAGFECNDDEFLDFLNPDVSKQLTRMVRINGKARFSNEEIAALFDLFVEKLEEKLRLKFKVIKSRVSIPRGSSYPAMVLGAPEALLVRDPKCISISKIEEVENNELDQFA